LKKIVRAEVLPLLLMLTVLGAAFCLEVSKSEPTEWVVPIDFSTIQAAIDGASPGDIIHVKNGVYYENVNVDKRLTLLGENPRYTIINGSGLELGGPLVHIGSNNVSFVGFGVTHSVGGNMGIEVDDSQYCEVFENIVSFTGSGGIAFNGGSHNSAHANTVHNCSTNGGIEAVLSNHNSIIYNVIYFNPGGIVLNNASFNFIAHNTIESNNKGINLYWTSKGNEIHENLIKRNAAEGIIISNHSNGTTISRNRIVESYYGVRIGYSFHQTVVGNYIMANEVGIRLEGSSVNNHMAHNSFINNTVQASPGLAENSWDNGYPSGGNYWSDFNLTDMCSGPSQDQAGSDGIGDTPRPLSVQPLIADWYPLAGPFGHLTPQGLNVTVFPMENVSLMFPAVSAQGFTEAFPGGDFGPPPPPDSSIEMFFHLESNATYSGNITMRIIYNDSNMTLEEEEKLRMIMFAYTVPGDVDWDYDVDIYDIVKIAGAYGSSAGEPRFFPECDLDEDRDVDIYDVVIAAGNYLERIPEELRYLNITVDINTATNIIYGAAPHLSIFGVTRNW